MPRKARPQSPEVRTAIEEIEKFCIKEEICIYQLSQQAEVSQSALHRFMSGDRKNITPTARKTLEFISKWHKRHNIQHEDITQSIGAKSSQSGAKLISAAIAQLWDGQEKSAEVIASLIKALRPALDLALSASQVNNQRGSR